jgi:UDP:flavonoid glycosyltransferase YjiC (YdhE family)
MGPLHEQLTLGDRMWGEQFVPQTAIVPQCDVMITHGGNNTVGEAFTFGVPTIVLPLFWDQYDNAQRVAETGFGERLNTYGFADHELAASIQRLLGDRSPRDRLDRVSVQVQARDGVTRAADQIEHLAHRSPRP